MYKVAILGSTGYVGEELVRLLYQHPDVKITHLSSHSYQSEPYSKVVTPELLATTKVIDLGADFRTKGL
ncbi:MAG: hypothetical protein RR448_09290 [Niameybacter sp.]|uniref:hypothetical protein n=1 Tax=Niameybacter sp. TaxID=2033640 RepID=UPI002FC69D31